MNTAKHEAKRNYKDGIFRRLFNDKEKILELYNALTGSHYPPDTDIQIITLDHAIWGDVKNDLAFIIDCRFIILTEHQSTINPNMPFRMLDYIVKEYETYYFSKAIYSNRLVKIPTPELYVFYNGRVDQPLYQELKLSDAFMVKRDTIALEAIVKVINVNLEKGAETLKQCKTMREYSQFVSAVKENIRTHSDLNVALENAIQECMSKGILTEFLKQNGGDVVSFLFQELTQEEIIEIREGDAYRDGMEAGIAQAKAESAANLQEIAKKLKMRGMAPDEITEITNLSIEEIDKL